MSIIRLFLVSAALVMACSITLAGCGGGGNGSSIPAMMETPLQPVAPLPIVPVVPSAPTTPIQPDPVAPLPIVPVVPSAPTTPTPSAPIEPATPIQPDPVAPDDLSPSDMGSWDDEADDLSPASVSPASVVPSRQIIATMGSSDIADGSYTFEGRASGRATTNGIAEAMAADVTLRLYLFTSGPSAGVNAIRGSLDNITVGGDAWWHPDHHFADGPVHADGSFGADGLTGQLYGPVADVKTEPVSARGAFDFMLLPQSGVERTRAVGTWNAKE